jgi:F-type H+-transporting ATPase subunit delta
MNTVLYGRYAVALVNIAFRSGSLQRTADDLETVSRAVAQDVRIGKTFGNPRIGPEIKTRIIDEVFSDKISDVFFINFLKVTAKAGLIGHLPEICREYLNAAAERYKILTVTIETPVMLTEEQIENIKEKCKRQFGADMIRETVVLNETLIGGMKITAGSVVMDGSLKKQLGEIEKLLNT